MKNSLFKVGVIGLLLLPFVIYFNMLSPDKEKIPTGYSSSIVAFEFVSNNEDLHEVLGELTESEIKNLDKLNRWDYGFMLIYGCFLYFFMEQLSRRGNLKFLEQFKWLAILVVFADAIENFQLLSLTEGYLQEKASLTETINILQFATWSKWFTLAIIIFIIGYAVLRIRKKIGIGIILFLPMIMGVVGFISQNRVLIDYFCSSIFLCFLILVIYSFLYRSEVTH